MFHKISNSRRNESSISGVRISVTCRIQVNSHVFYFYRHPTSIKSVVSSCSRDWWLKLKFSAMLRILGMVCVCVFKTIRRTKNANFSFASFSGKND